MLIGAHESVAGGLHNALGFADDDEADAVQIFTKNANAWREPDLAEDAVLTFRARAAKRADRPVLSHNSYLINLASTDEEISQRSRASMLAEVQRCARLEIDYVVFHPGSCGARLSGESDTAFASRQDDGLTRIAEALSWIHQTVGDVKTRILLENAAGSGGCLGCSFDHIGTIIERTRIGGDRLGVCVDSQHAFASGYDLRNREGYEAMWEEFDRTVGIARVKAFHLNDSKKPLGSRVDRHDNLGKGLLGLEPFRLLVNDARFAKVPGVVETPWPEDGTRPYGAEIALLRSLVGRTDPMPAPALEPLTLSLTPPVEKKKPAAKGKAAPPAKKSKPVAKKKR
jgi:deoxyribonuclease-4